MHIYLSAIFLIPIVQIYGNPSKNVTAGLYGEGKSADWLEWLDNFQQTRGKPKAGTLGAVPGRAERPLVPRRFSLICLPPRICGFPVHLLKPRPCPVCPANEGCSSTTTATDESVGCGSDQADDFVQDRGPSIFRIPKAQTVWLEAYAECKTRNGYNLVSLDSVEKYKKVIEVIRESGIITQSFWTCGTEVFNLPSPSNFEWMPRGNKVELTLPFWANRQPDNTGETQHCLALTTYFNKTQYQLDDQECSNRNYFICERMNNAI